MICERLEIPATLATPVTSVTLATSGIAVILATVVIREILETCATHVIIETLESLYHPAAKQHGQPPQHSLQAQRDCSRRSPGHNPRCLNRHRQLSLHGALSMLRPANCSR